MNHAFSKIWIIAIVVILLAGGILAWQYGWVPKEKVKAPEEEMVKDETADWKTYRNEEYGFEVKYPKDWIVDEKIYDTIKPLYVVSFSNEQRFKVGRIEIDIQKTNASSALDWAKEAYGLHGIKEIKLEEGVVGQQYKEKGKIFTAFLKDNFLYQIMLLDGEEGEPQKSEIETIYNQMLSTFTPH